MSIRDILDESYALTKKGSEALESLGPKYYGEYGDMSYVSPSDPNYREFVDVNALSKFSYDGVSEGWEVSEPAEGLMLSDNDTAEEIKRLISKGFIKDVTKIGSEDL